MRTDLLVNEVLLRGVIAAVFVLPLTALSGTIYPYHFAKWMLVLLLIFVCAWGLLLAKIKHSSWTFVWHPLLFVFGGFVVLRTVWGFIGISPYRSFWGDVVRLTGNWVWILFAIAGFLCAAWVTTPTRRLYIVRVATVSILVAAAFGWLVQYAPEQFNVHIVEVKGYVGRFVGIFGNSAYLAAYLLPGIFFSLALIALEKKYVMKIVWMLGLCGITATLYGTQTRAALLGVITGVCVTALVYVAAIQRTRPRVIVLGFLAASVVVGFVYLINPFGRNASRVLSLQNITHIAQVSGAATRLYFWKSAWQGFLDRPIGYGPELYDVAFDRHFDPKLLAFSFYETWADRPHNLLFEYLATMGVIGPLIWFTVPVAVCVYGIRRGLHDTHNRAFIAALTGVWGAYMGFSLFSFDTPSLIMHNVLALALLASFNLRAIQYRVPRALRSLAFRAVFTVGGLAGIWFVFGIPLVSAYHGAQAQRLLFIRGAHARAAQEIIATFRRHTFASADFLKILIDELYNNEGRGSITKEVYAATVPVLQKNIQQATVREPYSYRLMLRQAQLGTLAARYVDRGSETQAIADYGKARALSPRRQTTYFNEIQMYLMFEEFEKADILLAELTHDSKDLILIDWLSSLVAYGKGDKKAAGAYVAKAIDGGYGRPDTPVALEYALEVLEENNDYSHIIDVLRGTVLYEFNHDISNGMSNLRLARALGNVGKYNEARTQAALAVQYTPSLKAEAEQFIKELNAVEAGQRL